MSLFDEAKLDRNIYLGMKIPDSDDAVIETIEYDKDDFLIIYDQNDDGVLISDKNLYIYKRFFRDMEIKGIKFDTPQIYINPKGNTFNFYHKTIKTFPNLGPIDLFINYGEIMNLKIEGKDFNDSEIILNLDKLPSKPLVFRDVHFNLNGVYLNGLKRFPEYDDKCRFNLEVLHVDLMTMDKNDVRIVKHEPTKEEMSDVLRKMNINEQFYIENISFYSKKGDGIIYRNLGNDWELNLD